MKYMAPLLLLALLVVSVSAAEGPDALLSRLQPQGMVSDFAAAFATNEFGALTAYLDEIKAKTTAEIAVVALKSLEGGDVNDFANRLFQKWGIGKKGKDNGVLLVAAIEDRKVRIEVGYGLEGALPDAKAGRILDESVIPFFKEGRYAAGLTEGARAISAVVLQEAGVTLTNALAAAAPAAPAGSNPMALMVFLLIFGGFFGFMVLAAKKGWVKSGRSSGGGWSSHSSGGGGGGGFGGGSSGGGGASRGW